MRKENKGKCQYCGEETGNVKMHERYCDKNPNKLKQDAQTTQTQPPTPVPLKIQISNVQDIPDIGMRAWFNTKEGIIPLYPPKCGTVLISDPDTNASEELISVLVLTVNGTLLPPSMIAGFLGIFPEDMVFPEPQLQTTEQPPENKPVLIVEQPIVEATPTKEEVKVDEVETKLKEFIDKPQEVNHPEAKPLGMGDKLRAMLKK